MTTNNSPNGKHANIGLDGPIYHNAEDTRGGDICANRKVIPRREFGPDGAEHIFKETASLNNGNGSPHEGDGASKENHGYTTPHSTTEEDSKH
jgi:hypothetical protein